MYIGIKNKVVIHKIHEIKDLKDLWRWQKTV